MATRKAITLVSGLFQEVNTPTDKLDFAGNTTADLSENTNLYFTNTRARSAVSVTDAGGLGSLAYNSSTGVITYTGPSNSDIRGLLSIASGSGLTYNSSTGEFGTNAIPNTQLANSSLTVGSSSVSLGATLNTITGVVSLASTTLIAGTEDAANAIEIGSGNITFEGSTANDFETSLTVTDPTADRTITFPDNSGIVLTTGSSISNSNLVNSSFLIGSTVVSLGGGATQFHGFSSIQSTKIVSGSGSLDSANSITLESGNITFEGSTANDFETSLAVTDPTADRTITFPDATGTVALLTSLSIASGSGLTYNSGTGEFSTNAIPNSKLANSSITIGGTGVALGGSITTFSGLSSVTADAVVTKTGGFRVIDSTDNTKQLAFDASAISGSTTRTLAVPDASDTLALLAATQTLTNKTLTSPVLNGTISGTSIKDEDNMASDSASHLATQQSIKAYVDTEIAGISADITAVNAGTGLSGGGTSGAVTLNIDSTVATLTGSQTLTNKTLTSAVLNSTISGTSIKDEDNMASDSASHLATQQSIKAYVDTEIAGVPQGDITAVTAGTGLSGGGTTGAVSLAIDATVATLTGSQTLTNKTIVLGNNTVSGALANGITATTQSASDNSTKVATTAYVDNQVTAGAVNEFADNVFRVKDNSDASKKLAFECSGISGSTTRTMTVPNTDGTISTESFATAIAVALG